MWGNCSDDILWGNPVGQARMKSYLSYLQGRSRNAGRRVAAALNKIEVQACYRPWGKV